MWDLIGMDLIGPLKLTPRGNKYILTVTDYFSKWVHGCALKNKTAAEVASNLVTLYSLLGCPKRILSDQGREFVNLVRNITHLKLLIS